MAEGVELNGRHVILPEQPLPAFNTPNAEAYAGKPLKSRKSDVIAYILNTHLPPRLEIMPGLRAFEHYGMLHTVDWGAVPWGGAEERRFAVIMEKPQGRRLMRSFKDVREPMGDDQITRSVITPLVSVLKELSQRGLVHGAIRPTNMFYRDASMGQIMLGECVCAPCAYGQPMVLETIERGMCTPSARGMGSGRDDLYALGASIVMLICGRHPLANYREEQILQMKIERGSYSALTLETRVPLNLIEPLRGLLIDDPKQRWTLEDLDLWLSGRRLSPKQPQITRRAGRPYDFGNRVNWDCRSLAVSMSRDVRTAYTHIETGELDRWLRRSLGDETRAEAAENAVQSAAGSNRGGAIEDRMVARVLVALDPAAPMRYKGIGMMPDGIAGLLAQTVVEDRSPQPLAEIILSQLPLFWVNVQPEVRAELVPVVQTYDQLRLYLEKAAPGLGIERCIYDLNPGMACLSPLVAFYYCIEPKDVLAALNIVANHNPRPKEPFDRHIAAFLAARSKRLDDRMMAMVASADPSRRYLALISLLADVQRRHGPENLPNLARWLADLLEPVIARYNSRATRERLKLEARKLAEQGDISAVHLLIDDAHLMDRDSADFDKGSREYAQLSQEIRKLETDLQDPNALGLGLGRQTAVVLSSLVATTAILISVFWLLL
jgi:eukaryotic-like serine/threonine-protein kinase